MNCPLCQAALPDDAARCGRANPSRDALLSRLRLGARRERGRLAQSRERAAAVRDPGAYTPKHLADKILQSRSALEGERKQVTVLFADVKGSTELAEQLDPEAWSEIMQRFFRILADGVERFEGFVDEMGATGLAGRFANRRQG
jgi:class 3 adenylate cyclase